MTDWFFPVFHKFFRWLDEHLSPETELDVQMRKVLAMSPQELRPRVEQIITTCAKTRERPCPAADDIRALLPGAVRCFFDNYESLSFRREAPILDSGILRIVHDRGLSYIIIGRTGDEGAYYAVASQGSSEVFRIEPNNPNREAESDAPSWEHFVVLEHLMASGDSPRGHSSP